MLVYGVFCSKDAAELAVEHITHVIPRAKVKRFSPTRRERQESGTPDGAAPALNFLQNAAYTPYPMSFGNAWGVREAVEQHPDTGWSGGRTALRIQVPDKTAAERAALLMRQAGGAGIQQM